MGVVVLNSYTNEKMKKKKHKVQCVCVCGLVTNAQTIQSLVFIHDLNKKFQLKRSWPSSVACNRHDPRYLLYCYTLYRLPNLFYSSESHSHRFVGASFMNA
jgi:hypothetical protein